MLWFLNKMCTSKARLVGKIVVITGANSGIGRETARDLYARGARVILACRNMEMANKAVEDIRNNPPSRFNKDEYKNNAGELAIYSLDLSSLKSVRDCAKNLLTNEAAIHILINNAGVAAYPSYEKTEDGNETTLQVNHLGHFLLTLLLLPKMQKSSPNCRIVNVSSIAHLIANIDFDDINLERSYGPIKSYAQSKLANILFTKELARKLKGARVILACRNMEKTNKAVEDIKSNPPSRFNKNEYKNNAGELAMYFLDLRSLKSVRDCAKNLLTNEAAIHILVNNAAVAAYPNEKTEDGIQTTLQVNHLGHFLLTLLLLPKMQKSSPNCRIINVSSIVHIFADIDFDDINLERSYAPFKSYTQTKLANILFTKELARRLKAVNIHGINVYSLHPGIIPTRIIRLTHRLRQIHNPTRCRRFLFKIRFDTSGLETRTKKSSLRDPGSWIRVTRFR
ncbi:Retinol dehydrogenase 12 [Trachymyrmex zeteki]|uniref:Retinol dehydrogenase 12 n=1 Tax=Mycetomoellerius zeteki TaxID=64791 RepID=A0A151X5X7_9HYME|nr:Retinol dehydrogenase 12 [Trachymyrmex zeteki]